MSYAKLQKGEPDEIEYETDLSEEELLAAADELGELPAGADTAGDTTGEWADVDDPAALLAELDELQNDS